MPADNTHSVKLEGDGEDVLALIIKARQLRDHIYYTSMPNGDIERWANELGGVLGELTNLWRARFITKVEP